MRSSLIFLGAFFLTSCGITPKPLVRIQTVKCLTPEQYLKLVQAEPEKVGQHLDSDPVKQNRQLVQQNVLVRQYADGLLTVLGGCTAPAP